MKFSKTGKPVCANCTRIATHRMEGYDRIINQPIYVYHCERHTTHMDTPINWQLVHMK